MESDEQQKKGRLELMRGGQSNKRGRRRGPAFRSQTEIEIRESVREEYVGVPGRGRLGKVVRGEANPPTGTLVSHLLEMERRKVPFAREKAERMAQKIIEGVFGERQPSRRPSGPFPKVA